MSEALMNQAVQKHMQGDLAGAISLYQQVLQTNVTHSGAYANYAVALRVQKQITPALSLLEKALPACPPDSNLYNIYGLLLDDVGQYTHAINILQQALTLAPESAEIRVNLGRALHHHYTETQSQDKSLLSSAISLIEQALRINPNLHPAYFELSMLYLTSELYQNTLQLSNLLATKLPPCVEVLLPKAAALSGLKHNEAAIECYQQLVALNPELDSAWLQLGGLLLLEKRPKEALEPLEKGLALSPQNIEGCSNLGVCYSDLGDYEKATQMAARALSLAPERPYLYLNYGTLLARLRQYPRALEIYQSGLRLLLKQDNLFTWPDDLTAKEQTLVLTAHKNMAASCRHHGLYEEAKRHLQYVIDHAISGSDIQIDAHLSLSEMFLRKGDYKTGLWHYEHRKLGVFAPLDSGKAYGQIWQGENLNGKVIRIITEQGLGDVIQFCRFIPLLKQQGARIILQVHHQLATRILQSLEGVDLLITDDHCPVPYDYYCYLISAAYLLGIERTTIPDNTPYLRAQPDLVSAMQAKLDSCQNLSPKPGAKKRIGVIWAGNPLLGRVDRERSLDLQAFAPLLELEQYQFVSLQKGEEAEAELAASPLAKYIINPMDEVTDMTQTAALISLLDLVISVDTSVAHMAGALAKPVWILSRFEGCWRWLAHQSDSPWYKSARIYHQPTFDDWQSPLQQIKADLSRL